MITDGDHSGGIYETAEQFARLRTGVAIADSVCQQSVQSTGHQRQLQVGINAHRHGGRKRVHVKEVYRFSNLVFNHHSTRVSVHQMCGCGVELIGQQQYRVVVAEFGNCELADLAWIMAKLNVIVDDFGGAITPPDVAEPDGFPIVIVTREKIPHQILRAPAQGEKPDAHAIELCEMGISRQPAVEHQLRRHFAILGAVILTK